jgi:predicted transcriptional regulator
MKTTTIRIDNDILDRIDELAKSLSRSRSWVINKAIDQLLSYEEWFVQEVSNGLKEAKQGEFASNAEVEAKFQKWGINAD